MRYFTFPVRFQLNSDFSHTFLNGQLTRRTIMILIILTDSDIKTVINLHLAVLSNYKLFLKYHYCLIIFMCMYVCVCAWRATGGSDGAYTV